MHDNPAPTVRNPSDLVGVIACAVGIVLVCLAVLYAHNTTEGMAADVRAFAVLLQRILFVPVTVLDTVVVLLPIISVAIDLIVRRQPVSLLQGFLGAVGGLIASVLAVFLLQELGPDALLAGLTIRKAGIAMLTIPAYVSAITGLLTAVATPANRRHVTWSWNLLWISVVVAVVTTTASLPGMAIALLIGRMMGYAARYALGVASQRAYGQTLVDGIRRAGFAPVAVDRVSINPVKETGLTIPGVQTPQFFSDHRLYVMTTATDKIYNVIVLDGDRQVMSVLTRLWRYLRSRGIEGRTALSLRQTAERTALLSYTARSAGVATPAVLAIAEANDSMLIIREATVPSVSFADAAPEQLTDELLDEMWSQLLRAHRCGVVHRALTPDCFRIADGTVTLLGWETGDIAASELARRIDLTQLTALTATRVGTARALGETELAGLVPLLQIPAVPRPTRDRMNDPKAVLAQLRTELAQPDVVVEPEKITRLGARTVIMTVLVTMVIVVVLTSFNLPEVVAAVQASDWRWAVAAFAVASLGFVGASLAFSAYAPVKLKFWRVCVCQVAAAFVAMAAPAGLGAAAVNLRVLTKRNVPTPLAAATVALTQVTNVVVVALSLVVLTVVTGSNQMASFQVTPAMLIVVIVLAVSVAVTLIVPRSRGWILSRVRPMLRQTWPRLVELLSSPYRLAMGLLGNLIVVAANVMALLWAVYAFGNQVPFLTAAMVYLLGTTAGSAVPTPGGMGAIEVTEVAALGTMGLLNPGVATSIVLLFRVLTYWIRVPLGWVAYRWMRRLGEL